MTNNDKGYRLSKPIPRDATPEEIEQIHKEEEEVNQKVEIRSSRDMSPEERAKIMERIADRPPLPEPIPYEKGDMPEGNYMVLFNLHFQDMTVEQMDRIIAIVNIISRQVTGSSIGRSIYKLKDNDHSMRDHLLETYNNLDPNNPHDAEIIAHAEEWDRIKKGYDRIPVSEYEYWFKKIWDNDFDASKIDTDYHDREMDYNYNTD